ncbi:MAG: THUMP domain-containing protein [Thermoprotei archaeon]|nr:THUMP domain-containing protein [Thermoprotei archaeon]
MSIKLPEFNLLVSTGRMREFDCRSELIYLLSEVGDDSARAKVSGIPGLVIAKTSLNPFEAIRRLKELAEKRPWEFRYTLKLVPIERVVPTDFDKIVEVAVELAKTKIKSNEKFRITINKRFTNLSRRELIEAIAKYIKQKVDLEHPDKIVQVEILGRVTGISVITPDDVLSIVKLKRKLRRI